MASDTGSGHIRRNRPPRVHIAYADPMDSQKEVELPFVMGVMSDLSGDAPGRDKPPVADRVFEKVTNSTLGKFMEETVQPGLSLLVDNKMESVKGDQLGMSLRFNSMEDFEPAAIAKQIPETKELLDARKQLSDLLILLTTKPAAQKDIKALLDDPDRLKVLAEQAKSESEARKAELAAATADAKRVAEGGIEAATDEELS